MSHASNSLKCSSCKLSKKLELFLAKERKSKTPICKTCHYNKVNILSNKKEKGSKLTKKSRAVVKTKYGVAKTPIKAKAKTPNRRTERFTEEHAKLKQKIFKMFKNKCNMCGEKDPLVLQVDHVNGGGSKQRKKMNALYRYKHVLQNVEQYQLLCANCNTRKKYLNKEH